MITLTNGVSFSLEAGAICVIHSSKALIGGDYDFWRNNSWSLNINSTGTKTIQQSSVTFYTTYSGGDGMYPGANIGIIAIYTGNTYLLTFPMDYPDYGDSDS